MARRDDDPALLDRKAHEMGNPSKTRGILAVRADASEPKAILTQLTKAFEDFKAANDERLAGKADVVIDTKVDAINASVTDLQVKLEEISKATIDAKAAEDRMTEMEKLMGRIKGGGNGDDGRDVKAEAAIFLSGKQGVEAAKVDAADVEAYAGYTAQFSEFLRRGDRANAVQAAMSVGSDPDGGYWVPTQMSNDMKTRLFETSAMRSVASVMTITTDSVKFPTDTNTGTSGGWVGEVASRPVTGTPQMGEQTIYVHEQYASPSVTQKLLDMATVNVDAWLQGKITDIMSRTENTAFVTGNGVGQPRGFLDYNGAAVTTADASRAWGVLQYIVTGASADFATLSGIPGASDADPLINTIAATKPEYRGGARWACSRATEAILRKLKDGDGRYIVGMGDVRDNATGFGMFGYSITTMEDMPAVAADSFSLAFGNFNVGYQIVDGRGFRTLRDPFTAKPYVIFYTTKWTGGDVVNFDAIKLVKFGTS